MSSSVVWWTGSTVRGNQASSSPALKMEAVGSYEMLLRVYQNTLRHDRKDGQPGESEISVYHFMLPSQKVMPILSDLDHSFPKSRTVSFLLEKVNAINATSTVGRQTFTIFSVTPGKQRKRS
jgi:hypothetical protein